MTNATITRENFTAAMEQAVAERGEDFVYPDGWREQSTSGNGSCQYYVEGVGGACIIGKALENLGVDTSQIPNSDAMEILTELGIHDEGLVSAALTAQVTQDSGGTWGQALAKFKEALAG